VDLVLNTILILLSHFFRKEIYVENVSFTYMHVQIVSTCRNGILICMWHKKKYEYGLGNHGDAPVIVFRNDANGLTSTRSLR
jgi:hypothetical protein